ncbi:sulfurtransferase FdhD, partial [Campylobacter jejuni]|nr:sulfurtransferase FdhD [Campylobacter jejuni]
YDSKKFDLTLCGFARENKINIYSGEFRIHG